MKSETASWSNLIKTISVIVTTALAIATVLTMYSQTENLPTENLELKTRLLDRDRELAEVRLELQGKRKHKQQITSLKDSLSEKQRRIIELEKTLNSEYSRSKSLETSLSERQRRTIELEQALKSERSRSKDLEASLPSKKQRVTELEQALSSEHSRSKTLGTSLSAKKQRIIELEQALSSEHSRSKILGTSLSAKKQRIIELEQALKSSLSAKRQNVTKLDETTKHKSKRRNSRSELSESEIRAIDSFH